jgi:hypothetical protein
MNVKEITITLPEAHPGQEKIRREAKRFNVVDCGRRWGKSLMAVDLLAEVALNKHPAGYFAPTYKLLDGTYNECLHALSDVITRKHEHQFIELITGGRIEFWSLENQLAGRSRKYKRVILDEAAFSKDLWSRWTESIRATLTDFKGDAWFLSTPKGKNDFYKLYNRGKSGEHNWMSWQMPTLTNPYIDPEEIADAQRDLPEAAFRQEYLAEFLENTANPFGFQHIQQCTYPISMQPAVCYGIDLAKSYDWTVIIGLDSNGNVCYFDRFQKDWRQTIQTINALPKAPIKMDSTGTGDPIFEEVARSRDAEGFIFNQRSKQTLMEGLAVAIQQRRISFPDNTIKEELENFEFEFTRSGVKYSAPAGLHDDCVCALALAWSKWGEHSRQGQYSYII